ncbi:hypothetical protein OHC33_004797 [Knufia fluminis]|uniref:Uncharacterized protein n=1 Tax=Knufia fluminis TaxID=191047 RepID=A0AAN8EF48_9EURO|nr:hypothetical protein OHC33_004797 [Knufia fluminis]
MADFKESHGHNPRRHIRSHLPFIHASPSETPPSIVAPFISTLLWAFTVMWFSISLVGYVLIWKFTNPLPAGETMNIERIFDTVPLNRWAVNVMVSWFSCTCLFVQTLFLVGYRVDRRVRGDFAREIFKGEVWRWAREDVDTWDNEDVKDAAKNRRKRQADIEQQTGKTGGGDSSRRGHGDDNRRERDTQDYGLPSTSSKRTQQYPPGQSSRQVCNSPRAIRTC